MAIRFFSIQQLITPSRVSGSDSSPRTQTAISISTRGMIGILVIVGMALRAVRFGPKMRAKMRLVAPAEVFLTRNGLQVVGVDTSSIATQVVNIKTRWGLAHKVLIAPSMRVHNPCPIKEMTISIRGNIGDPQPTSIFRDLNFGQESSEGGRLLSHRSGPFAVVPSPGAPQAPPGLLRSLNCNRFRLDTRFLYIPRGEAS